MSVSQSVEVEVVDGGVVDGGDEKVVAFPHPSSSETMTERERLLEMERERLLKLDLAPGTRRVYESEYGRFNKWRGNREITDELIADYVSSMNLKGLSVSYMKGNVTSIRYFMSQAGMDTRLPVTDRVLMGIARESAAEGRGNDQAFGIQYHLMDWICGEIENENEVGLRDAIIFNLMFDCLLRASEILALTLADVDLESKTIEIRMSKTDQLGEGATKAFSSQTAGRMRRFYAVMGWNSLTDKETPLIPTKNRWGTIIRPARKTSYASLWRTFDARGKQFGYNFRSHSLRVGCAQSLLKEGASLPEMMVVGRWKSPQMPAHYARKQIASDSAVLKRIYGE